jgi:hypothetical protein
MKVYLDTAGHLWSADQEVLHAFAARIGLRREWYQDRPVLYHYDLLTARRRLVALEEGAVYVSPRILVRMMRANS